VTVEAKAKRTIRVRFLTSEEGGRRSGVPNLSSGQYMPHLVVGDPSRKGDLTPHEALSGHHMLGVRFVNGPAGVGCDQLVLCVVELLYTGVDYAALRAEAGILVVEGRRIVATGHVLASSDAG